MDAAPIATLLARAATLHEIDSARPWAPVVEARPHRTRARRSRAALAAALNRTAELVAPPRDSRLCSPAH